MVLNRGNHEDFSVCCLYGFQTECCEKYDEEVFGMFSELFQHIPLFAIINDSIFVVHGGLFHDDDVSLEDLAEIDRSNFSLRDVQAYYHDSEILLPMKSEMDYNGIHMVLAKYKFMDAELVRQQHLHRIQLDALWSDPSNKNGIDINGRGASVLFGPDVVRRFLDNNKLKMIIRSHECVQNGYDTPYKGDDESLLVTIFSASDYGGGRNSGAYMQFKVASDRFLQDVVYVRDSNICYSVLEYIVEPTKAAGSPVAEKAEPSLGMVDLIKFKEAELRHAFKEADTEGTGEISRLTWANVMHKVTLLRIRWLTMIPFIVHEDFRLSGEIKYDAFLDYVTKEC